MGLGVLDRGSMGTNGPDWICYHLIPTPDRSYEYHLARSLGMSSTSNGYRESTPHGITIYGRRVGAVAPRWSSPPAKPPLTYRPGARETPVRHAPPRRNAKYETGLMRAPAGRSEDIHRSGRASAPSVRVHCHQR